MLHVVVSVCIWSLAVWSPELQQPIMLHKSTLVISKSKGPAETLRDIRTSTYQKCRIEENTK